MSADTDRPDKASEEIGVVQYDTPRGRITLTVQIVRRFFCPEATELEALAFAGFCKHSQLNPFVREAYLVKYPGETASIITAYQSFMKRAERAANYGGFRAGVVLLPEKPDAYERTLKGEDLAAVPPPYIALEGTLVPPGYKLAGGWCVAQRTDRTAPKIATVSMEEYRRTRKDGQPTRAWREMPATMIRKVAIGQAHREEWPDELTGLVLEEEGGARIGEVNAAAGTVDEMAEELLPQRTAPAPEATAPGAPNAGGGLDEAAERKGLIDRIEHLREAKRVPAPQFARLMHAHLGSGNYDAATLDALVALHDAVTMISAPTSETPARTQPAGPAKTTAFEIGSRTYQTAGIDKATLLATFKAEDAVEKQQKGLAKQMLKKHFGVESRTDLTREQGHKYLELLRTTTGGGNGEPVGVRR